MRGVASRLRALRQTQGLTAQVLADMIKIKPGRYTRYERAEVSPPLEVCANIAVVLGCSLDWLILGEGPFMRPPTG